MITLQVNGKNVELERATPLLAYIEKLGVDPRAVAVEHNGTILERAAYETITLNEGDTVEIVRMVGGGRSGRSFFHWSRHSRLRDALHTCGSRHTAISGL
jgi:sulfur carrier protein